MKDKQPLLQMVTAFTLCITGSLWAAENDDPEDSKDLNYNGSDCISIRSIRDYKPLDEHTLLIWGGSRPYVVRLATRNREMRSSSSMRVDSRDDRLCPYGGDGLVFDQFGSFPVRVRAINRITKEQLDQILVRHGKKGSGEPQTPPPVELEGAEVEELD